MVSNPNSRRKKDKFLEEIGKIRKHFKTEKRPGKI